MPDDSAQIPTDHVLKHVRPPHVAIMLFGSMARGAPADNSDIDVLQLVSVPRPSYKEGKVSVSVYSCSALKEMALQGSLFVLHLKLEGKILYDPQQALHRCLSFYREMNDYSSFFSDLSYLTKFLDLTFADYSERAVAVNQMAIFILRSTLFAILARQGRPQFAMEKVAECFHDPAILQAYSLKRAIGPEVDCLDITKGIIEKYLQCRINNEFGSYEALLLNSSRKSEFIRSVALHFLKRFSGIEAYGNFKEMVNGRTNHSR